MNLELLMDGTKVYPTWQALVDYKDKRIEELEAELKIQDDANEILTRNNAELTEALNHASE